MRTIFATNVNDAYRKGLMVAVTYGDLIPSRNGNVHRVPMPVCTRYSQPTQRVLFDGQRHANPFFHLFEGLWMLAGREDVSLPMQFIPSFEQFSDDGVKLHGAYGYRWRNHFGKYERHDSGIGEYTEWNGIDQLETAIRLLKNNPHDRRVVIGMWDPAADLDVASKDIPCNDLIKCGVVRGKLDIQVYCRSNDIVFGAYGANAVHMSMLHEYLAAMVGIPVGIYYQISGDFHAYADTPYKLSDYYPLKITDAMYQCPYGSTEGEPIVKNPVTVYPLVADPASFDAELSQVMMMVANKTFDIGRTSHFRNTFFADVAQPMYQAHRFLQQKHVGAAHTASQLLANTRMPDGTRNDWITAAGEWCARTITRRTARTTRETPSNG